MLLTLPIQRGFRLALTALVAIVFFIIVGSMMGLAQPSLAQTGDQYADGEGQEYTINVSGDEGVLFFGNIGAFEGGGGVQGSTPEQYTLQTSEFAGMVSANVQKASRGQDLLRVEIVRATDGEVVAEDETTEQFGDLSVTYTSDE